MYSFWCWLGMSIWKYQFGICIGIFPICGEYLGTSIGINFIFMCQVGLNNNQNACKVCKLGGGWRTACQLVQDMHLGRIENRSSGYF